MCYGTGFQVARSVQEFCHLVPVWTGNKGDCKVDGKAAFSFDGLGEGDVFGESVLWWSGLWFLASSGGRISMEYDLPFQNQPTVSAADIVPLERFHPVVR